MKEKGIYFRQVILTILAVFAFTLACPGDMPGLTPETAQAAVSSATKAKAEKAYRNFMYESDYTFFRVIDVDRDGLKDLLVTYYGDKYNGKYRASSCHFYTYSKGRVVRCGDNYSMFGIKYNSKTKRVHGSRGGGGAIENWYYTFTKGNKLKYISLRAVEKGISGNNMLYNYYFNGKKISMAKYNKKVKIWYTYSSDLRFYKTTVKNLKKNLKI